MKTTRELRGSVWCAAWLSCGVVDGPGVVGSAELCLACDRKFYPTVPEPEKTDAPRES